MSDQPGHGSPKAARILAAAGELLLGRGSKGVTIAEVAQRSHVGKGTVYLYWKTKEDLLLDLVCRDFLAMADEVVAAVTADPGLARPSRLCPAMLRNMAAHPYVGALKSDDSSLLGALADDPRSARLLDILGPDAVMRDIVPIWRDNALARTDWTVEDQAFALRALVTGFLKSTSGTGDSIPVADPERVLAAAVTALLGPEHATAEQVRAAADAGIRDLTAKRAAALDLISLPQAAPSPH
ncbi:TetR/AcrR family transcriptional regulator [Lentzea sp. NPDC058436]|uniref:TetR/AcrR family transcriptional regulator n=1 Tax=Lentzea sp. NPDC058436 TaxID=3346499 RepID=UPI0036672EB1